MGRNKYKQPLDKFDRKRMKNGDPTDSLCRNERRQNQKYIYGGNDIDVADTRGRSSSRGPRHSQTSDNSWVHAVLFVVLLVIVVSWALGY